MSLDDSIHSYPSIQNISITPERSLMFLPGKHPASSVTPPITILFILFFKSSPKDMFTSFTDRKGEGERRKREKNIDVREKHGSVSQMNPTWGPNLQPSYVP